MCGFLLTNCMPCLSSWFCWFLWLAVHISACCLCGLCVACVDYVLHVWIMCCMCGLCVACVDYMCFSWGDINGVCDAFLHVLFVFIYMYIYNQGYSLTILQFAIFVCLYTTFYHYVMFIVESFCWKLLLLKDETKMLCSCSIIHGSKKKKLWTFLISPHPTPHTIKNKTAQYSTVKKQAIWPYVL